MTLNSDVLEEKPTPEDQNLTKTDSSGVNGPVLSKDISTKLFDLKNFNMNSFLNCLVEQENKKIENVVIPYGTYIDKYGTIIFPEDTGKSILFKQARLKYPKLKWVRDHNNPK